MTYLAFALNKIIILIFLLSDFFWIVFGLNLKVNFPFGFLPKVIVLRSPRDIFDKLLLEFLEEFRKLLWLLKSSLIFLQVFSFGVLCLCSILWSLYDFIGVLLSNFTELSLLVSFKGEVFLPGLFFSLEVILFELFLSLFH